jgi:hypothetical protein
LSSQIIDKLGASSLFSLALCFKNWEAQWEGHIFSLGGACILVAVESSERVREEEKRKEKSMSIVHPQDNTVKSCDLTVACQVFSGGTAQG